MPTKSKAPNFMFGTSQRQSINKTQMEGPGPGKYIFRVCIGREGTKPALRGRPISMDKRGYIPGPGTYDQSRGLGKKVPSYSIGQSKRSKSISGNLAPGPGQYESKYFRTKSPAWMYIIYIYIYIYRVGSSQRNDLIPPGGRLAPGPGAYLIRNMKEGPSIGIAMKLKNLPNSSDKTPAPGSYQPSLMLTASQFPSFKIGTSQRSPLGNRSVNPGPAEYNISHSTNQSPRYG